MSATSSCALRPASIPRRWNPGRSIATDSTTNGAAHGLLRDRRIGRRYLYPAALLLPCAHLGRGRRSSRSNFALSLAPTIRVAQDTGSPRLRRGMCRSTGPRPVRTRSVLPERTSARAVRRTNGVPPRQRELPAACGPLPLSGEGWGGGRGTPRPAEPRPPAMPDSRSHQPDRHAVREVGPSQPTPPPPSGGPTHPAPREPEAPAEPDAPPRRQHGPPTRARKSKPFALPSEPEGVSPRSQPANTRRPPRQNLRVLTHSGSRETIPPPQKKHCPAPPPGSMAIARPPRAKPLDRAAPNRQLLSTLLAARAPPRASNDNHVQKTP